MPCKKEGIVVPFCNKNAWPTHRRECAYASHKERNRKLKVQGVFDHPLSIGNLNEDGAEHVPVVGAIDGIATTSGTAHTYNYESKMKRSSKLSFPKRMKIVKNILKVQ